MRAGFASLCLIPALVLAVDTDLLARYQRADALPKLVEGKTQNITLRATWIGDTHLVYRAELPGMKAEYRLVEAATGKKEPAFDHRKLAESLAKQVSVRIDPERLNLSDLTLSPNLSTISFRFQNQLYEADRATVTVKKRTIPAPMPDTQRGTSPDGIFRMRMESGKLQLRLETSPDWVELGQFHSAQWSPDSLRLVAFRLIPGDRKSVYRIQSSRTGTSRGKLISNLYDQPGDRMDTAEVTLIDVSNSAGTGLPKMTPVAAPPFYCTQYPYFGLPSVDWRKGGASMLIHNPIRGFQAYEIWEVDPGTGAARIAIREESKTFVDQTRIMFEPLRSQEAFVWQSESSGWAQLYRVDAASGERAPITRGEWVVRSLDRVDEAAGTIDFSANGREPGDPCYRHYYRIGLDGKNLVHLTPGAGTHELTWSPSRRFFVDTYSTLTDAPKHELRRADGTLVSTLEVGDVSGLKELKIRPLQPFVAKGRDGKTDIWGCLAFPSDFDPKKRYPVIENIYAGPHDSHAPKRFFALTRMHRLAELGFIVVQMDGMGTSNRGKAFHDVCWKNLKDAGFPDRIAWMKAAAKKYPAMDLDRVGIYGTSAGGQNAAGAVLFHPEFYRAAVASCGCHDNRIDKQWWNEQWMGYPVGPHYAESSNIDHAANLRGRLLLMVGELDSNVPPESTFRFADALIKAKKEFDLVVLPGMDHTDGGEYGERKRRDFFVRWLLGKEPPVWNGG